MFLSIQGCLGVLQLSWWCTSLQTAQVVWGLSAHTLQGMCLLKVPGGWAAQRWGGRRMLMVSFGLWSTASMLTPGTASSKSAILLARVAVGVAQGFLIPSVHTVLSQVLPYLSALMWTLPQAL